MAQNATKGVKDMAKTWKRIGALTMGAITAAAVVATTAGACGKKGEGKGEYTYRDVYDGIPMPDNGAVPFYMGLYADGESPGYSATANGRLYNSFCYEHYNTLDTEPIPEGTDTMEDNEDVSAEGIDENTDAEADGNQDDPHKDEDFTEDE